MSEIVCGLVVALVSPVFGAEIVGPARIQPTDVKVVLQAGDAVRMGTLAAFPAAVAASLQAAAQEHIEIAENPQRLAAFDLPQTALLMATLEHPQFRALIGDDLVVRALAVAPNYHQHFGARLAEQIQRISDSWRTPPPETGVALDEVPERWRRAARILAKAQKEDLSVAIHQAGKIGGTRGQITDLRVEHGRLHFRIDGEPYDPLSDISVSVVPFYTDAVSIIANVSERQRLAVEALLEAQEAGIPVSITESDFAGEIRGRVSGVRLEYGRVKFTIDGRRFGTFSGFSVRLLHGGPTR